MPGPVFGHIPGYPVGSWFENRAELADARVHRHRQAGISGSSSQGADSIVLSGGYEDDEDHGDVIVYTGYGGGTPLRESRSLISPSACGTEYSPTAA
jgi:putative restriction endonuclease